MRTNNLSKLNFGCDACQFIAKATNKPVTKIMRTVNDAVLTSLKDMPEDQINKPLLHREEALELLDAHIENKLIPNVLIEEAKKIRKKMFDFIDFHSHVSPWFKSN